ncbi:MAG: hypothetical protein RIC89_06565 [Pseudomonadales bacterium]
MAALILTFMGALFLGGGAWFVLGSRFRLDSDDEKNDLLNFCVYYFGALPASFVLVFFGLG